jgi:hypothetical protein
MAVELRDVGSVWTAVVGAEGWAAKARRDGSGRGGAQAIRFGADGASPCHAESQPIV